MSRLLQRSHDASRGLAAAVAAAAAWLSCAALGQTPPAQPTSPPTSPRPLQRFEYDANGNLTRRVQVPQVGGTERHTVMRHDPLGRLASIVDARNGITSFVHDPRGLLTAVTDPLQLTTFYDRDGHGQTRAEHSPDAGATVRSFDPAGRLVGSTDARGQTVEFSHDALGRLVQKRVGAAATGEQVFAWTYDQTGPAFGHGIGRLTTASFPGGVVTWGYDGLGAVVSEQQTLQLEGGRSVQHTTGYGRDAAGRLVMQRYPSGRALVIAHGPGGRPLALSLTSPVRGVLPIASQISWEPFGPARSWRWSYSGQLHETLRDLDGRVVRQTLGPWTRELTYDAHDRPVLLRHRVTATAAAAPTLDQAFEHDELDRLTRWTVGGQVFAVGYDANGNRTWSSRNGVTTWLGRQAGSNRQTVLANPLRTAQYDAAGNLVSTSDGKAFSYDPAGRMVGVAGPTFEARYAYDDRHRRVWARVVINGTAVPGAGPTASESGAMDSTPAEMLLGADPVAGAEAGGTPPSDILANAPVSTTAGSNREAVFVYDSLDRLIGEYSADDGAPLREYFWLEDTLMALAVYTRVTGTAGSGWTPGGMSETLYFVHSDHLNTPRVVVDTAGALRWTWLTDPFGELGPNTNPAGRGTFSFNLRLPGQYRGDEAGLNYNWHRYYDAGNGRYVQSDPIGLAGGINTYAYVESQPTRFTDPRGQWSTEAHDYFLEQFFENLDPTLLAAAQAGSRYADSWRFQDDDHVFMHAMSSRKLSPQQSRKRMCDFIKEKRALYSRLASDPKWQWRAFFEMGMALHPAMDATSPAHRGFQLWRKRNAGDHGPNKPGMPSLEDIDTAKRYRAETLEIMRRAFNGTLDCECLP